MAVKPNERLSTPDLMAMIEDRARSTDDVCDAARFLAKREAVEAIDPLLDRLRKGADPEWVQVELLQELGALALSDQKERPPVGDYLLDALSSDAAGEAIKDTAVSLLGFLGEERALPIILARLEEKGREQDLASLFACILAAGRLSSGREDEVRKITAFLNDQNLAIRRTAAEALGTVGPAARIALPRLKRMAEEGEPAERKAALEAVKRITS